jgi:arsenate reductase
MAAAFFNAMADGERASAVSAGTEPAERVHPVVVQAMGEVGIDVSGVRPQQLTEEMARGAEMLITMGCGEQCPMVLGVRREDWPLEDPKGKGAEAVRRRRVAELVRAEGVGRAG